MAARIGAGVVRPVGGGWEVPETRYTRRASKPGVSCTRSRSSITIASTSGWRATQASRRPARVGIHDVVAAPVRARCRDGEVARREHRGDAVELERVLDADAPRPVGRRTAAHEHVAACVEHRVPHADGGQPFPCAPERPALDVAGGLDGAASPGARARSVAHLRHLRRRLDVEGACSAVPQRAAGPQHRADAWVRVRRGELAAVQPRDLAVAPIGGEGRVHPAQPGERRLQRCGGNAGVADVDRDRQPHDVLDAAHSGFSQGRLRLLTGRAPMVSA
jgi:hypothetical protein